MIYSDQDMLDAIASGDLLINPYFPQMLRNVGLALHLGADILVPDHTTIIDIKNKVLPEYKKFKIEANKPFEIKPGDFVLAHTYESVSISNKLGIMIEGRSTIARLGLTVVQTAMLVDPGHRNRPITLEIANHGPNSVLLYPKMKIARAVVFECKTACKIGYDENGKYRDQLTVGAPIFEDEFLKD